ncbi:MAG: TatD family hydrolase [Clostridiales bacterium]|nr:TatD family hydrolase [Clostridiales bacterium]
MALFDTHAHLTDERFDGDRAEVLRRLLAAGVDRVVTVGDASSGDAWAARALAEQHECLYFAAGVHPHDASKHGPEAERAIRGLLAHPKAVALGEVGLDFHYDLSPRDAQRQAFEAQLDLALALGRPVILHIREAHGEAIDRLLARSRAGRLPRGVMHCFSGSWESAKRYLDMGMYISLSGSATFKNAPKLQEVARNVPADRLLVETDCPYLAPEPMRGRRNEPAFVAHTAARVARLRGEDAEEFAARARQNGMRLFDMREDAQ